MMIDDEICKDTMQKVLDELYEIENFKSDDSLTQEEEDKKFEEFISTKLLEKGWYHLAVEDKILLEDCSAMFNTYNTPENLYNAMQTFVILLAEYRYDCEWKAKYNELHKQRRGRPKNESKLYRQRQFLKDVDRLLDYIGHIDINNPRGKEKARSGLRRELFKARDNASDYIDERKKTSLKITKEPIRKYLHSLSFDGKYNVIEQFIKEL